MKFWEMFWTLNLLVAGTAFAFITLVVTLKGVKDLRQWFGNLRRQNEEDLATGEGMPLANREQ
jgi:hypothetical protein